MVLTPWMVRNWMVSGTPLARQVMQSPKEPLPGTVLERSAHPDLTYVFLLKPIVHKFFGNLRGIFENDLPKLGGSWAAMFFLAGLLLGFRSTAARRMRYFLLMCLGTFIVFQALGQTELSIESPQVNSENLIVLMAPLVFIYGGVFFLTLSRQIKLPAAQLHYAVTALFVAVSCLPMIFVLCAPKTVPVAYPPYYPPDIQKTAGWMKENELMMSDVPWAVAWYGHHQCVWLTLNIKMNSSPSAMATRNPSWGFTSRRKRWMPNCSPTVCAAVRTAGKTFCSRPWRKIKFRRNSRCPVHHPVLRRLRPVCS